MTQLYPRFTHWLLSHYRAMCFALTELTRAPITNLITICVIGIAMALPLGFFILLENMQTADSAWNSSAPTISLYLKASTTQAQVDTLIQNLHSNSNIKNINYISPEQGLKSFEKNSSFANVVNLFQNNPIPGVIVILPIKQSQSPTSINTLYLSLKQLPSVDIAQLDMHWVTRLYDVILVGGKIVRALSILFCFGVILIIAHALRSSLASHLNEIQVMRLIGATRSYIRRPLLYRGALYGLLGGTVSFVLINVFLMQLQPPITQLAQTYHTLFLLQGVSLMQGFLLLVLSGLLGLISAWLIISQFLNRPEQMD
ncbi:MAG: permease-like cell division protein FtsX [Gammaproteobacteria bacterium]|nr:permease-like cell division protein FtsX [Gammaproteobacteria bacterium]